jgi:type II secretory pathway pseudopilin PulG
MRVEILAVTMLGASLLVPLAGWSQSSHAQTRQQAIKELQEKARQAAEERRKQLGAAPSPSAAAAGGPATDASPEPLTARVDQAVMGPRISNGQMTPLALSDDGDHIAIVAPKGSRQVVLVDGRTASTTSTSHRRRAGP